jgi:hypothetical protein
MKRLFYFSSIITLIFITACSKNLQDKMIGYWKQVPFYNPDSVEYINYWQFYAGGRLDIYKIYKNDQATDTLFYTYEVNSKTLNVFGEGGYTPGAGDFRGGYWIDVLNKKYFKITKREHPSDTSVYKPDTVSSSPYLRIEFVKQ